VARQCTPIETLSDCRICGGPGGFYNPSFPALFSRNKLPSRMYRRTI
jgi:hypothetical protein